MDTLEAAIDQSDEMTLDPETLFCNEDVSLDAGQVLDDAGDCFSMSSDSTTDESFLSFQSVEETDSESDESRNESVDEDESNDGDLAEENDQFEENFNKKANRVSDRFRHYQGWSE